MHILEIKLAGQIKPGPNIPDTFANISRIPGSENIKVTILTCDDETIYSIQADSRDDVYSAAQMLQSRLDGCKGTPSMVNDYMRIFEYFTD